MKTLRLLFALMGAATICIAQGPSLTKEETINYLNKKAQEVVDHYRTVQSNDKKSTVTYYYSANTISMSGDKLKINMERKNHRDNEINDLYYPCDYHRQIHDDIFNPAHILSIEKGESVVSGEPIGLIKITLKYNTGLWNFSAFGPHRKQNDPNSSSYGKCYDFSEFLPDRKSVTRNSMNFAYLQSDETNFNKIKKALEYLRDLCKAEDDPFGN